MSNTKTIKIPGGTVKVEFTPNEPLTFKQTVSKIRLMALELDNLRVKNELPKLNNGQKEEIVNTLYYAIKDLEYIKNEYTK